MTTPRVFACVRVWQVVSHSCLIFSLFALFDLDLPNSQPIRKFIKQQSLLGVFFLENFKVKKVKAEVPPPLDNTTGMSVTHN